MFKVFLERYFTGGKVIKLATVLVLNMSQIITISIRNENLNMFFFLLLLFVSSS